MMAVGAQVAVELQWGRDLTVADRKSVCPLGSAGPRVLQWGRDLTVADSKSRKTDFGRE